MAERGTLSHMIDALRRVLASLPRQEAAVATAILSEPESVLQMSVSALAERAGVSQPTVIRLCRSVGCEGFADFKLRLAQNLAAGVPFVSANVTEEDDAASLTGKIFDASIRALQDARNQLDVRALHRAIELLDGARRVVIFGLGGSAATALDAQHKFSRFPTPCQAVMDPLMVRMLLAGMGPEDVFLALSNTGRTQTVLELASLAIAEGIAVVAITAPESPLSGLASVVLGVQPAEDAELFTPMASRMVHLAVIDVLSTGVALRRGTEAHIQLARVKTMLRPTRLPLETEDG